MSELEEVGWSMKLRYLHTNMKLHPYLITGHC